MLQPKVRLKSTIRLLTIVLFSLRSGHIKTQHTACAWLLSTWQNCYSNTITSFAPEMPVSAACYLDEEQSLDSSFLLQPLCGPEDGYNLIFSLLNLEKHTHTCKYVGLYLHIFLYAYSRLNCINQCFHLHCGQEEELCITSNLALSVNWQGRIPLCLLH